MTSAQAARKSATRRALALALAVAALGGGTALAATISGDGTLIGTNSADTIKAGQGNDTVYGLLGADTITAGNGNDVIDGDGQCMAGSSSANYCSHGHGIGDGTGGKGDTITTGNGNNRIYGGGGQNTISVGTGSNLILGGPISDTIYAGPAGSDGGNAVYLDYNDNGASYTGSTVYVALGQDYIYARNGKPDKIVCPPGNQTTVYADTVDSARGCQHVYYGTASSARLSAREQARRQERRHRHHATKLTHSR